MLELVRAAYVKLMRNEDALDQVRTDLRTLLRLAQAWAEREYTRVPWKSVLYVVGALIYLLNPADALPDMLAGIGFVDDIAVITAVARAISKDLAAFRQWEQEQTEQDEPAKALEAADA